MVHAYLHFVSDLDTCCKEATELIVMRRRSDSLRSDLQTTVLIVSNLELMTKLCLKFVPSLHFAVCIITLHPVSCVGNNHHAKCIVLHTIIYTVYIKL